MLFSGPIPSVGFAVIRKLVVCCTFFSFFIACGVRQKRANNLQNVIEQLSANKADRRELLELKQFMVSLNVSAPLRQQGFYLMKNYGTVPKGRLDC